MKIKVPFLRPSPAASVILRVVIAFVFLVSAQAVLAQPRVSLLVVGDWGTGGKPARKVGQAMADQHRTLPADAVISTGDNIYTSGVRSVDDPQWQTKFERIYPADALAIPFWAVLGNHDHRGNADAQVSYTGRKLPDGSTSRWRMPARNWSTVFRSGDGALDVRVVGIDTDELIRGAAVRRHRLAWLDSVLATAKEDWIVCVGHYPVYSHGHYGDTKILVKQLAPILEKYGVDVYCNGHEHDLQVLRRVNGVRYIVSGAGAATRKFGRGKNTEFASSALGFVRLDFGPDELRIRAIDSAGTVLHEVRDARK